MWDVQVLHVETAELLSGMRTHALAPVTGGPGLPGRDAHLLHHRGAAVDPGRGRGPPRADQGAVRRGPARAQRRRPRRAALAGRVGRPRLDALAAPHLAPGE